MSLPTEAASGTTAAGGPPPALHSEDYLDLAFNEVEAEERMSSFEAKVKEVKARGQALMYESRFIGSLVSGNTARLAKFKQSLSFGDQMLPMLIYHMLGPLAVPFQIRRWGRDFTRATGVSPCYQLGSLKSMCNINYLAQNLSPVIVIHWLILRVWSGHTEFGDLYEFTYTAPILFCGGAWFFRVVMIAMKYGFVSKFRFRNAVENITKPETHAEWFGWHLGVWVSTPELVFEREMEDAALAMGRSINDPKYDLLYCDCFRDEEDAERFSARINRHLRSSHGGKSNCATVFNVEEEDYHLSAAERCSNYMVRSQAGLPGETGRGENDDANTLWVNSSIGVRVSGVSLAENLLLQATDELRHEKESQNCVRKCCFKTLFSPKGLAILFVVMPLIASLYFLDDSHPGTTQNLTLRCYSDRSTANITASQHEFQAALSSLKCAHGEPECAISRRIVSMYLCATPKSPSTALRVQYMVLVGLAVFFTIWTLSIDIGFFELGVSAYRRQFFAVRRLNALVANQIRITSEDDHDRASMNLPKIEECPPILDIRSHGRSYAYYLVYDMLRGIGSMYYSRIQSLVATLLLFMAMFTGIYVILPVLSSLQDYFVHASKVPVAPGADKSKNLFGPFTFMFVALLAIVYFVVSMVDAGGETNTQVTCSNRLLLEHQLSMFVMAEKIRNGQGGHKHAKRAAARTAESVRLSKLREYLLSAARGMEDTRMIMVEAFQVRPIKFLYLEAGPRLIKVIGSQIVLTVLVFITQHLSS
jgi:hypothetical protein